MKNELVIEYEWRNKEDHSKEISATHIEALKEDAEMMIKEDLALGLESGSLSTGVRIDETDGEDGVEYVGKWKFK